MSEQPHEDPVAHASTKITSYVSVAAMAAEALAQVAAARARERAAADERAASALRAERLAAYGQARLGWSPVLDPKLRERTSVTDAGRVWASAQAWRPDPEAERASGLAEDRLRELRPDVMDRYDRLRGEGVEPADAMRRVAPWFDSPPPRVGEPGPDRAALPERDTARRAGDAELTRYRGQSAGVDNPRAARVDEHGDAVTQAAPHLARTRSEHAKASALSAAISNPAARGDVPRSAATLAAEGYPKPIQAASVDAVKTAASGRPVSITTAVHRAATQQTAAAAGRPR